jgi:fibronectin-binding autotransporter adhesin
MQGANSGVITLTAGLHDIIVRMFEGGGGNGLYVQWDPTGGTNFVDIPGANFFHGSQTAAAASLPTTNLDVPVTSTLNLSFAGKATLGDLTLGVATLTPTTGTGLSFGNVAALDNSTIAGTVPILLRTGNISVPATKTLTITPGIGNDTVVVPINKTDTGTLVLNGVSNYTGATNVTAGTLSLGGTLGSTAITVSPGATFNQTSLGTIGGTASLTVSGTAVLSGANTYSGATTVNAGSLTLGGANTTTGATILNGGTLIVGNAVALERSTVVFNGGILDTGVLSSVLLGGITANVDTTVGSVLTTISGFPTWTAAATKTLNVSGTVTRLPGSTINFGSTGTISGAGLGTLLGVNTVNAWATFGGADWAVYDGSKIAAYTGYTSLAGTPSAPVIVSIPGSNYKLDNTTTNNATLAATGTIDIGSLVMNDPAGRTVDVRNGITQGILRLGVSGGVLMGGGVQTIGLAGNAGTLTAGGSASNTAGEITFTVGSNGGTINSTIADNGNGIVSITKIGAGTLTLNGNNTYSGNTTVNAGSLNLGGGNGIPNGVGKGDVSIGGSGTMTLLNTTETINGLNGGGTVIGDGASAGRLTVGDGNANGVFSGVLKNGASGLFHLTKTGTGTQTLTGISTYTGTTTVSKGILSLDFSVSNPTNILANTTALTLGGGTLAIKGKSVGTTAQTVTGLALAAGSGLSSLSIDANGGGGSLLVLGAITRNAGSYLSLSLPAGNQSATNGISTTTPVVNSILGSYATIGSNWVSKSGSTLIVLENYTNIAALGSTLANGSSTNVRINSPGAGANIALGVGTSIVNTILQNTTTAATVDTLGKILRTSGIMLASGQSPLTIGVAAGDGVLSASASGGELVLINNNAASNLTINASIQDNTTASSLAKLGPGTVVLAGSNTFTGTTHLVGGTLEVSNSNALQRSTINFNGGVLNTGILASVPVGGITASVDATVGSVLTGINGFTTWTAAAGRTLTVNGPITRSARSSINFAATGTITGAPLGTLLGGSPVNAWATYGGTDWAVYDGSKIAAFAAYTALSGTGSAPTITSSPTANYRIDNATTNNVTLAAPNTIDINTLVMNGSTGRTLDVKNGATPGILRLNATGGILMSGGTQIIGVVGSAGVLTSGGSGIDTAGELLVTNFAAGTINSVIANNGTGSVSFNKQGTGTLTLGGINTYSGDTTINAGILTTAASGSTDIIPNGPGKGNVIVGPTGSLTLLNATETINGLSGSGTVFGDGASAGRLTLGSNNASATFSGVLRNGTSGIMHLTKIGTGTQTLTGTSTYTGSTTVNGGILALDFSINSPTNIIANTTALTLGGGTLAIKAKSSGTTSQTVGGLTLTAGSGLSTLSIDANGGGGTLLTLSPITRNTGSYINFVLPAGAQSVTNGITTTSANNANGILGSYATVGSNWATKSSNNIIALATYTDIAALGSTIANAATSNVRINSVGAGANIALGAATTNISTLLQNTTTPATVDTLAKTLQTSGIMLGSGQAALTIGAAAGNGILTGATAGGELVLINRNAASNLVINAAVQNHTSAAPIAKFGAGTVVLNGINTYTGATTVAEGTLSIGPSASLANTTVTVQSPGTLAGTGTIGGSTTIQGFHAVGGVSAGVQTFSNSLAYAATSHLQWQLDANSANSRGTNFDGVNVTGGSFSVAVGATIDLTFGGTVDFLNSFWGSNRSWLVADLGSGLTGDGGSEIFTLGTITGGSNYGGWLGSFAVTRVADVNGKKDVMLNWSATPGGSPYNTWIASKGLSAANALPEADPDFDGLPNSLEFVLGGEPNPANPGFNSRSLLPTVTRTPGGDLVFTFRRKDLSEGASTLAFQWSTDLAFPPANLVPVGSVDSNTGGVVVDVTEDNPDAATDLIVITVPASKTVNGRLFGRLATSVP